MLIPFESVFWQHVQDKTPPPLDGSDASAKFLAEQFPNSVSQERLDSKTLKAEHPTLYKQYSNKTSYRRFSVKAAS